MPRTTPAEPATAPPPGTAITCPHYQRVPRSKRCRHYSQGGHCQRPEATGAKCVEWLKLNAPSPPPPAAPQPAARDLFGAPVSPAPARRIPAPAAPAVDPAPPPPDPGPPLVRSVTDEQIASFKALGVEVCIQSEALGHVWLVPEYTGTARAELSVEHSVTLTTICAAFPGAKVVELKRRPA